MLPRLTEVFGWRVPPCFSQVSSRAIVYDAELSLCLDPDTEREKLKTFSKTVLSTIRETYLNHEEVLQDMARNPELLFGSPRPASWLPLVPDGVESTRMDGMRKSFRNLSIDTILKISGVGVRKIALLQQVFRLPQRADDTLSRFPLPSKDEWNKHQEALIAVHWQRAAAKELSERGIAFSSGGPTVDEINDYAHQTRENRIAIEKRIEAIPPYKPKVDHRHRDFGDLTYGVEIECYFPEFISLGDAKEFIAAAFEKVGLKIGEPPTAWSVSEECSIHRFQGDESINSPEIVSPILRGPEVEDQIRRAMHALTHLGCKVNHTCGLHAGIGHETGFTLEQAKELLLNAASNEHIMDGLVQPHRAMNTGYHASMFRKVRLSNPFLESNEVFKRFEECVSNSDSLADLQMSTGCAGKASNVNLTKLPLNYVEFRQLEGTLEADKVLDWIQLNALFVDCSLNMPGKRPSLDFLPLGYRLGDGLPQIEVAVAANVADCLEQSASSTFTAPGRE